MDDPYEQTDNPIVIAYESEEFYPNSNSHIGNGERVDQNNEDPPEPQNNEDPPEPQNNEDSSDPQTILVNDGMSGGIVRFTVPSDGMKIISPKTLHDKFSP